jgi:hypothetical protein
MYATCRTRTGSSAIRAGPGPHHHVVSPQHHRRGRRSNRCSNGLNAPRCTGFRGPLQPWAGCTEAASRPASAWSRQAGAQATVGKDARSERLEAASTRARSGRDPSLRRRAIGPRVAPASVETRLPRRRCRVPCRSPHLTAPCRTMGAAGFEPATSRVSDKATVGRLDHREVCADELRGTRSDAPDLAGYVSVSVRQNAC